MDSLSVTFSYTQRQANVAAQSCALMLNMQGTAGVHETGPFSATLILAGGTTKASTSGVFDAPVTILGSS